MVESMRAIVKDSFERLAAIDPSRPSYTIDQAKAALKGGIWYPVDYLRAHRALKSHMSPAERAAFGPHHLSGYASPPAYFERDLLMPYTFRGRDEVTASVALAALLKGPTLIGCTGTHQIAVYETLRQVLGQERFDKIFQGRLVVGVAVDIDLLFKIFFSRSRA